MDFVCPHCDLDLKCDDDLAGQVVRCPNCEGKLQIPDFEDEPDVPETPTGGSGAPRSAKKPSGRPGAARRKGRSGSAPSGARKRKETASGSASKAKATWQPSDSSNVSVPISFAIGLAFMIVFYALTFPIRKAYYGALFWGRGWVPFACVLLLGWSFAILFLKMRKLKQQKRAMLLDVLPDSIGDEITVDNVQDFIDHIVKLPANLQECLLVNRVHLGLQHFQVRHSNPEVANMMMSQSEIDASTISSSYSLLKVFLWAIPILGFVGTVVGISGAVAGFSKSLAGAQDIAVLKASLNNVTNGLSVAFDTTLVALVMSLLISFPLNALQKAENDLLGWVDAYCNENLLKRLNDVAALVGGATGNVEEAVRAISQSLTQSMQGILGNFREVQDHMADVQQDQAAVLKEMARGVAEHLETMSESSTKVHGEARKVLKDNSQAIRTQMEALTEGLTNLNDVLAELGGQQIVIEQQPRRHWWQRSSSKSTPKKRRS